MIPYIFYSIYFLLFFLAFFVFAKKRYVHLSILPFLFFPHFNSLCLLKVGLTFSFLETYMFLVAIFICLRGFNFKKYYVRTVGDKVFWLFLLISLVSIIIARVRIVFGNLEPALAIKEVPLLRSLMSLNKLFVFILLLPYIRTFYLSRGVDVASNFKKYLALSAILPTIAVFIQSTGVDFTMLFNNPSFGQEERWASPNRPFGLSYEASFYALLCFFSFMGVYYADRKHLLGKKLCRFLYVFYIAGVVVTISRTGLLVFILFIAMKNLGKLSAKKIILVAMGIVVLANVTIMGFGIIERFTSSFDTEADASNIERFGSTFGLLNLLLHKGLVFGVGIFNYYFYLYPYMPSDVVAYMQFDKSSKIVSFNMILQIIAEWGVPLFLFFMAKSYRMLKEYRKDGFDKDWFIYFFFLSLSVQMLNFSMPYMILLYASPIIQFNLWLTQKHRLLQG